MSYLLFHSANEPVYVRSVKDEMDGQLEEMNSSNMYLAKKTIRKVLRTANKHIRFSGTPLTELELRIHFCKTLKETEIPIRNHPVLLNLYNNQVKKIRQVLLKLDEDLRFDFQADIDFIQTV